MQTFLIDANLKYFLGFGMAIVEKEEEDYTFTHGAATSDHLREFTDSTIFNLGSVSKLFTAMAVVKLAEVEVLNLDDPVYFHFPEFLEIKGKNKQAHMVTILDLLQHRSGIYQSMEDLYPELFGKDVIKNEDDRYENTFNYRAALTKEDFVKRFELYAQMDAKPGRKYAFSNLGYVILGYIVEELTGSNLGEFVTNEFFEPLGMEDSHYFQTEEDKLHRMGYGYYRLTDGSYINVHENEVESPSPTGDGGIKTSIRDMIKFMKFLNGTYGDPEEMQKILPRTTLLTMIAPLAKGPDKQTYVGLGFHNIQPYNFSGHAGGWDGFLSVLYYHPESHSCLFMVTNREDVEIFKFLQVYSAYAMNRRLF